MSPFPFAPPLRALLALATILSLAAAPARADDTRYQDYPIGNRALTLGGAFTAIADDASGLTYNPAGLVDTQDLNVSVSASLYGLEREAPAGSAVVNGSTFSLGTLASLSVIPGEAGSVKAFGEKSDQGSKYAYGFDLTVPSYRSYGSNQSTPSVHTTILDRTFDGAAGGAIRLDSHWSVGAAAHFTLRQFSETEAALVTNGAADPTVGVYQAQAAFSNASLSLNGGVKRRFDDGWLAGASLSTPGVRVYSSGSVEVTDVQTNPNTPPPHTLVNIINTSSVESETGLPFAVRVGAAKIMPTQWTFSSQLTLDLPTTYSRFELSPSVAERLQLQTRVHRHAVLNANVGAEYNLRPSTALGVGLFTDFSTAPALDANPDGSLTAGSSHLDDVSLYGGTASVSFIGEHSVSRFGISLSYGTGETAVPVDPTGISNPDAYTKSEVSELFLYFFLAGSFRY